MLETNEHYLTIDIQNSNPIIIKKFDTPLQIAHRFCNDNNIELRLCKIISESIISIMKTFINDFAQLKQFNRYFGEQETFEKKQFYTIGEILGQKQQQQQDYSFTQDYQIGQQQCNSIPLLEIYKSPKENSQLHSKGSQIDTKKIEDMNKKLYQHILSPDSDQIGINTYIKNQKEQQENLRQNNQIVNNISSLQKQLMNNQATNYKILQPKSQEKSQTKSPQNKKNFFINKKGQYESNSKQKQLQQQNDFFSQMRSSQTTKHSLTQQIQLKYSTSSTKNQNRNRCITESGEDLFYKACNKIFNQLDNDKDGIISPTSIDLSKIPDNLLNYLYGILLDIDNNKLRLNSQQFYKLFEQYYEKLDVLQRQRFLSLN